MVYKSWVDTQSRSKESQYPDSVCKKRQSPADVDGCYELLDPGIRGGRSPERGLGINVSQDTKLDPYRIDL